ncbi:MAG: hypothetical protein ACFFAO_13355 [Candidatus Hermodarchaeota archaeon]
MSEHYSEDGNEPILCYNCEADITNINQLHCPKCGIILKPNDYVKWRNSFLGFLCLLCVVPILIAVLISIIYIK